MAINPNTSDGEKRKVKLKSSDDKIFEVEYAVAVQSQMLKYILEGNDTESAVPLHTVSSNILAKVIEYCEYHVHVANMTVLGNAIKCCECPVHAGKTFSEEDVKKWDQEFVKVDQATLFHLAVAARYLEIENLSKLLLQTLADMIKGQSPETIRRIFNIQNDWTPEEEEEVRRENEWAFV